MFDCLTIENFRCLRHLRVEPLARVNLIGGRNNVGKTALLEAVFLLLGNPHLVIKLDRLRGMDGARKVSREYIVDSMWRPLLWNYDERLTARVALTGEAGRTCSLALSLQPPAEEVLDLSSGLAGSRTLALEYRTRSGDSFLREVTVDAEGRLRISGTGPEHGIVCYYLASSHRPDPEDLNQKFSALRLPRQPLDLVEDLRILEPRLRSLEILSPSGVPMLFADIGLESKIPLHLMGEGLARLTSILLLLANARGGIVLVDEMENGLHYSSQEKVWEAIGRSALRFNTQLFATTHSWECLRAARALARVPAEFRYHRLEQTDGEVRAVTYAPEEFDAALEVELEVR